MSEPSKTGIRPRRIWTCKIGETRNVPSGGDLPMREIVEAGYFALTGERPKFLFSGWGAELTESERAVHENSKAAETKKVELCCGDSVDEAFNRIQQSAKQWNCETFGEFNGNKIYSIDTIDEAYQKVTGCTKSEHAGKMLQYSNEAERKDREHKDKIPELTKEYIQRAKGIIREDKAVIWAECVPIRLGDLYRGMELQCTLDLADILKSSNFEKAKKVFADQGHSGMSHSLVCHMLKEFAENGEEFVKSLG